MVWTRAIGCGSTKACDGIPFEDDQLLIASLYRTPIERSKLIPLKNGLDAHLSMDFWISTGIWFCGFPVFDPFFKLHVLSFAE